VYEVYASTSFSVAEANRLPWVTYDKAGASPASALDCHRRQRARNRVRALNDAEEFLQRWLLASRSLLPSTSLPIATPADQGRCQTARGGAERQLWLLAHSGADARPDRGGRRLDRTNCPALRSARDAVPISGRRRAPAQSDRCATGRYSWIDKVAHSCAILCRENAGAICSYRP
jgi:hypothetical protein